MKKNKRKGCRILSVILLMLSVAGPLYAEEKSYLENAQRNFGRGLVNMLSSPLEIPIGVQKAHESAGFTGVRHFEGLVDGIFNTTRRFGSGAWDWVVALIPSDQDGLPMNPETLF